jgi:hypothetical protein
MPVKDSHTRIKPLALASGHGRYIPVKRERTLYLLGNGRYTHIYIYSIYIYIYIYNIYNRYSYKFLIVSLLKRLRNGRFASEIATWIQKRFKNPLELLRSYIYIIYIMHCVITFFKVQGGGDGRDYRYRDMCKIPRGPTLNERG